MAYVLPTAAIVDPQKTGGLGLNVRDQPLTRGKRVGTLRDNTRLAVVGVAREAFDPDGKQVWYQVQYQNTLAYCHGGFVRLEPDTTISLPLNAVVDGQKTGAVGLNLRETPSRTAKRLTTMRPNSPLRVIGAAREGLSPNSNALWYHVLFGATRGFCSSDFVGVGSTPSTVLTATVSLGPFVGVWPVVFPNHVITAPFNQPRSYGLHEGIDLRTGANHPPILAWADGVVASTWVWDGVTKKGNHAYGNHVKIFHPALGITTMYCHLNSFSVSKDRVVHMGEEIGRGGTTGNSTADHLHFMVIDPNNGLNGYVYPKVVDPLPYLPKPYTFK